MKALSNRNKLKAFIAPNITDLITLIDNSRKLAIYTGENIHGIYCYMEMIRSPITLTTSNQHSHNFGTSSSINNETSTA